MPNSHPSSRQKNNFCLRLSNNVVYKRGEKPQLSWARAPLPKCPSAGPLPATPAAWTGKSTAFGAPYRYTANAHTNQESQIERGKRTDNESKSTILFRARHKVGIRELRYPSYSTLSLASNVLLKERAEGIHLLREDQLRNQVLENSQGKRC